MVDLPSKDAQRTGERVDTRCEPRVGDLRAARYDAWLLWQAMRVESAETAALREELSRIRSSRSWRITAPLRRIMALLKKDAVPRKTQSILEPADQPWQNIEPPKLDRSVFDAALWLSSWLPEMPSAADSKQLLVDVTEVALEGRGGGIQRMVGRLLAELIFAPPAGYRVTPVRLTPEGGYVYARRFYAGFVGLPEDATGQDSRVEAADGDLFIGLDLVRDHAQYAAQAIRQLRFQGATIAVLLYDLLPMRHPSWFPEKVSERYVEWLDTVALNADVLICISETVRTECEEYIAAKGGSSWPKLRHIPLGADFVRWQRSYSVLPGPASSAGRFLMVGTIEPRKGHSEAIAAFEQLWAEGANVHLVIAGRIGWKVGALESRLRSHPEKGRRLHFIEAPSDQALASLYCECDHLLMPSHGEGFGLPVIEALRAGCRLVLRDLPVLREAAGERGVYFSGNHPGALAAAVMISLDDAIREGRPNGLALTTWAESASALKRACGLTATITE